MSGICRVGVDTAGGTITGSLQDGTVKCNGSAVSVHGDAVAPHGDAPHAAATMVASSSNVFINGIAVCKAGNLATCGHAATGSGNTNAG